MWHTIAELKGKFQGKRGVVVGTGPTADYLYEVVRTHEDMVIIGINRAIVLHDDFDFIFVDHPETLRIVANYAKNTRAFLLPMFSRGQLAVNSRVALRFQDVTYLYSWVWECSQILRSQAATYSLNQWLLYISWGNAQSALHLAKLMDLQSVIFLGCDGGLVGENHYAKKIVEIYGMPSRITRRHNEHKSTRDLLPLLSQQLQIPISFYEGQDGKGFCENPRVARMATPESLQDQEQAEENDCTTSEPCAADHNRDAEPA